MEAMNELLTPNLGRKRSWNYSIASKVEISIELPSTVISTQFFTVMVLKCVLDVVDSIFEKKALESTYYLSTYGLLKAWFWTSRPVQIGHSHQVDSPLSFPPPLHNPPV
jgi:hypothetical protein